MKNYKIHFAGSTTFSVKILESLIESGEEVELIISQPAKKSGRGLKLTPTPVSQLAMNRKIKLLTPTKLDINLLENNSKKKLFLWLQHLAKLSLKRYSNIMTTYALMFILQYCQDGEGLRQFREQ